MNIADLFDDSALDLELEKIKQKIAKLYNEVLEKVFKIDNPTGSEEELAAFLEENGLQFNNEQGSFEEETSEIQDILDQMLSSEDTLDPVKDRNYSKPTVESGAELKAHKETKDLPEMSSLPEPKGLMATPKDSHTKAKTTFKEPEAYSGKLPTRKKVIPVDVSYAPLVEQFTDKLADIEQRRNIGREKLLDRLG
jgi:hypothetical protein